MLITKNDDKNVTIVLSIKELKEIYASREAYEYFFQMAGRLLTEMEVN